MPSAKHSGSKSGFRKQSYPSQPNDEPYPQKTISELFATSKHGSKDRGPEDLPGASPNKKLKLNHSTAESNMASTSARIIQEGERFNFSNPATRRPPETIDLTSSPNGSPAKKKAFNGRPTNITPHTGPKMLMIKGLKKTSKPDPDEYYNRVWAQLDTALSAIFLREKLPYSMEELYRGVEIVCKQGRAFEMYKKLCEKCTHDISSRVKEPLLQASITDSAVELLNAVVHAWSTWSKQMETIRSIFFYLDRSYLLHSNHPSIDEMGTTEFRTHIFSAPQLQLKILQGACDLVHADRQDDQEARNERLFRDSIKMFHSLIVYQVFFEPKLMAESERYFVGWAEKSVTANNLGGYVEECGKLIERELSRCDLYGLDQTTKKALEKYLEDILVDQRQARLIIVDDVAGLLGSDRSDAVSQLYDLLQRLRLGEKLRPAFEAFIVKQGSSIVFDEEREQEMVIRLLDFKKKLDSIWEHSFRKHEGLGHTLREAFETFINQSKRSNMTWGTDNPKPGEMIAKYVDMVLKGGTKAIRASGIPQEGSKAAENDDAEGSSEDEDVEIGRQLDQVLDLFRFVHGKAVFEAFYKRDLARRLLLGRSASSDAEKSMLTRLKSGTLADGRLVLCVTSRLMTRRMRCWLYSQSGTNVQRY